MNKPLSLETAIDQLTAALKQKKEQGGVYVEADPTLLADLAQPHAAKQTKPSDPLPTKKPTRLVKEDASSTPTASMPSLPNSLEELAEMIAQCKRCALHQWRTQCVPGVGCSNPEIMFIGEGPGKEEDRQGLPFVGRSGELLTRLINKMGYTRETVFIGNIVKCRPTVNNEGQRDRPPTPEEMQGCLPYLKKQIEILQPKVLVLLGNTALHGLFGFKGITKHRGKWLAYEGIDTMPTYHPSYLLRNGGGNSKPFWEVWEDMAAVLTKLGHEVPETKQKK